MKIRMEEDILSGTGAEIMDQLRARVFDPTGSLTRRVTSGSCETMWCVPPAWTSHCRMGMWEQQARMMFAQLAKVGALTILEN